MLKDWNRLEQPSKEEMEQRLKKARARLEQQQILMKEKKLPVLVLLEGWGAAGKGSVLGKIIKNIDPRFFKVAVMDEPTEEEARKPFLRPDNRWGLSSKITLAAPPSPPNTKHGSPFSSAISSSLGIPRSDKLLLLVLPPAITMASERAAIQLLNIARLSSFALGPDASGVS